MSTALVEPHMRPVGSLAQPSTVEYGFGRSLTGAVPWPLTAATAAATLAQASTARVMKRGMGPPRTPTLYAARRVRVESARRYHEPQMAQMRRRHMPPIRHD